MARSILFICADTDTREMYGAGLRQVGILPVFVDSVSRALAFYRQVAVPLTVLHLEPDTPAAWDECSQLISADVPVVVLTAHVRSEGRTRRLAAAGGCAAFIAEPCAPSELADIVRRVAEGERGIAWPDTPALKAG